MKSAKHVCLLQSGNCRHAHPNVTCYHHDIAEKLHTRVKQH
jgi:hypothetical protein